MKSKRKNSLFSFHPAMLTGRQQRSRYGRTPFNRRVAAMVRRARGQGHTSSTAPASLKADVQAALEGQGYHKAAVKKAVGRAHGEDFSAMFKDAQNLLRANPKYGKAEKDHCEMCGWRSGLKQAPDPSGNMKILCTDCRVGSQKILSEGGYEAVRRAGGSSSKNKRKNMKRKNKMPAGLRRYWAKKRKAKNVRRKTKNSRRKASFRSKMRAPAKRTRRIRARKIQRRSNPRVGRTMNNPVKLGITLSPAQKKKLGRQISRLTGKRVRWV